MLGLDEGICRKSVNIVPDCEYSQIYRSLIRNTHEHLCLILGNIDVFTESRTPISKIVVVKLDSCVRVVF